ncbi:MAG: PEP-CTERM sorting domain-containing protein [Opitutaceae bacterium]|nr:PEP-CTERM sorting domain-containing protein [Opitutaceae bacterium]
MALPAAIQAQATFDGSTAYTQNFDMLPVYTGTSTASFTFTSNSTLPGWYYTSTEGRSSAGQYNGSAGQIYNWGSSGSDDRALGIFTAITGGFSNTPYLALQLRNTSGETIDSVTLTFDVEQWRRNTNAVIWSFDYLVTPESSSKLTSTSGYTANSGGNATSLHTGSATGLNGNTDVNRTTVSVTLTGLNWANGDYLWLRWSSNNAVSTSSAIALDNLKVEVTSAVPEPAAIALLAGSLVLLAGFAFRRWRAN